MSDPTTVRLITLKSQDEAVDLLVKKRDWEPQEIEEDHHLITRTFCEVNYGELHCSKLGYLKKEGIPYVMEWENGSEYGSGTLYSWFTEEGEYKEKTIYDADFNPDLSELMKLLNDPAKLIQYIKDHKENVQPVELTPEMEHYGKKYKVIQLIS
jgi:hypothetical protein